MEWFRPHDQNHVEEVLTDLREVQVGDLRTAICRAEYESPGGPEWYDWLLPRLAAQVHVLPCLVHYPAITAGGSGASSTPEPAEHAAFVETIASRYGKHFEYLELPSTPIVGSGQWNGTVDAAGKRYSTLVQQAAAIVRRWGKKAVLGGFNPSQVNWFRMLVEQGAMDDIDVVGLQGLPPLRTAAREEWQRTIEHMQGILDTHRARAQVWVTEAGCSTHRYALLGQVEAFLSAIDSPAERVYWYAARDVQAAPETDKASMDEREFHFGLKTAAGNPKLLSRIWAQDGIEELRRLHRMTRRRSHTSTRRYTLITGGAGFIGSNLAHRLLSQGRNVMVFDTLARPGVERNLEWLQGMYPDQLLVEIADIRNAAAVREAVEKADQAFDFSAQVAVTTSLVDPVQDFEINARGTLNLLEAIRATGRPIPLVFTSTNKVYGSLADVRLRQFGDRYEPVSRCLRTQGIDEGRPLDFHSPYGCSKGAADQYVIDYARTMGSPAVVFRMSCIYGPRQFGTEDQGWVAHFLIRAMQGLPITLYGDGRQVRDILFVEDLLDAFELAQTNMSHLSGEAFNIGGGPPRTISLLELIHVIEELTGEPLRILHEDWRPADQKYYVSNTLRFQRATGWGPKVGVIEGVRRLYEWLCEFHLPHVTSRKEEYVSG